MIVAWEAAGATDVGRLRRSNEDTFHLDTPRGIFLVADGMGGHAAGEVASQLARRSVAGALEDLDTDAATEEERLEAVHRAVLAAHASIERRCREQPRTRGMGTTLTCCLLHGSGSLSVAHIGDSRLYRMRGGRLEQLTRDHTWVQQEVESGRLLPEAAHRHPLSHILTRVLSDDLSPIPDLVAERAQPGDLLLLCSDGLYNMVPGDRLGALLGGEEDLGLLARSLIDEANRAGGSDNITVVVIRIWAAQAAG